MNKIFFSEHLLERFGRPMYRVPIDLPLSCPHRVSGGGRGCVFCPEDGARARHLRANLDIPEQVRSGVEYVRRRYGVNCGLIAYLQSFTNTNAPVDVLRRYYDQVLNVADFSMIIIATRSDCLPDAVLDYLSELAREYELLIELGVQTSHDATLSLINRGHDFKSVRDATAKLAERGIASAAHVILGLPGESSREFRETAAAISALPFSAIKIHNMLVLRKTPLAASFAKLSLRTTQEMSPFASSVESLNAAPVLGGDLSPLIMNEYEYADVLLDFISRIPDEWPLMRLTTDAPPETVVAPKWWMSKGQFLEYFKKRMSEYRGFSPQGDAANSMPEVVTADGSKTLYHPKYRQHFHSLSGARTEALKKFVEPCDIREKLVAEKNVRVLDIGFGLGKNVFALCDAAKIAASGNLEIVSLEMDERPVKAALGLLRSETESNDVLSSEMVPSVNRSLVFESLLATCGFSDSFVEISLLLGDARKTIGDVHGEFDAVFLDAFSHDVNPELWTYDFIKIISAKLAPDGVIATYSAAFPVRGAMARCGLRVGETPAVGRRKGGTIASFEKSAIIAPLDVKNMRIIKETTTGVAYRDPCLNWNVEKIRWFRSKLIKRLSGRGVPKWLR